MTCRCSSHNGLLTAKGLAEAAQREDTFDGGLAVGTCGLYLDLEGSVSGLRRDEEYHVFHDELIEEQYRRFLSGS